MQLLPILVVLLSIFVSRAVEASVIISGEVGVKHFYQSVDKNDRQDGLLNIELGYFNNYYSLDLGFLTGSIKREYKIIEHTDYTNSFPNSMNFSNSIDILFGIHKRVDYSYFLYLKTGVNISTIKLHNSIGSVHPVYRFNPKVKVGLGYIHKNNIITLNYHHLFSVYGKLAVNPDEPYNFRGYPEQGFVTIGIMHAI